MEITSTLYILGLELIDMGDSQSVVPGWAASTGLWELVRTTKLRGPASEARALGGNAAMGFNTPAW